jgi:hypothetical protein
VARRPAPEEVVRLRVAVAKARLRALAASADARPSMAARAAWVIRAHPWQGVGAALAAGLALGVARRRGWLAAAAPVALSLVTRAAGTASRQLRRRT